MPVQKGKYVGRDLYGRVGSGDVKIKNGKRERRPAGLRVRTTAKRLASATNMLPQKEKDDEDWQDDAAGNMAIPGIKTAKINKELAKAMRGDGGALKGRDGQSPDRDGKVKPRPNWRSPTR